MINIIIYILYNVAKYSPEVKRQVVWWLWVTSMAVVLSWRTCWRRKNRCDSILFFWWSLGRWVYPTRNIPTKKRWILSMNIWSSIFWSSIFWSVEYWWILFKTSSCAHWWSHEFWWSSNYTYHEIPLWCLSLVTCMQRMCANCAPGLLSFGWSESE